MRCRRRLSGFAASRAPARLRYGVPSNRCLTPVARTRCQCDRVSLLLCVRENVAPVCARAWGEEINRMNAIPASSQDLLNKLEAVRLLCQETGCAQRYLGGDGLAALRQATRRIDADKGTQYSARLDAYIGRVYSEDLSIGIAMTDGKGDRCVRTAGTAIRT